jgi:hypothetical protein
LRTAFAALSCSLFLLAAAPALAAPGELNASWNSGRNDQGNVAFWIRGVGGSCEEQMKALPLVFGAKNLKAGASSGPLQVKELSYCFLYLNSDANPKDPEGGTSSCVSGSVEFAYDAVASEYSGKYDLTMKNKAVRRGEFRAQLCKPREPAKKQ